MATNTWQWVKGSWISMTSQPQQSTWYSTPISTGQTQASSQSTWLVNSIRETKRQKDEIRASIGTSQNAQRNSSTMSLYSQSLTSTSEPLKKQYEVSSKFSELASMIVQAGKDKWYDITWSDSEIVWTYLNSNPDRWEAMYNFTHWKMDAEDFAIQMGWMKAPEKEKAWFWTNVVWWAYDSATWIPRMIAKYWADAIGWVAKKLWVDEDRVDYLVNDYKNYLDEEWSAKALGADTDSATYKVSKWVSDLAQTAALGALGKAWLASKLWWPLVTKATPTAIKAWVWALEWAADMAIYSAVSDSELPTAWELALWAWLGAALPIAWAWLKAAKWAIKKGAWSAAAKLELNWLMTPAKLRDVQWRLISEWVDVWKAWLNSFSPEDVWKYMLERWWKWEKPTILAQIDDHVNKAIKAKSDMLAFSTTTHSLKSVDDQITAMIKAKKGKLWLKKEMDELLALQWKKGKYTAKDIQRVQDMFDDTFPNLYRNQWPQIWEIMDSQTKKWLANLRKETKRYLEDTMTKEWLGDLRMLNNEIQVWKQLYKWISDKERADVVREVLSAFSKPTIWWVIWWYSPVWVFSSDTPAGRIWNAIVGALAGKYLFSTKAKTTLASHLYKLSWWATKELDRLLAWEITKLSKSTQNELTAILQDIDALPRELIENIPEAEKEIVWKYFQESLF